MKKDERFTFLLTKEERALLNQVAKRLNRTPSDAVRVLVRGVAEELALVADGRQTQPLAAREVEGER